MVMWCVLGLLVDVAMLPEVGGVTVVGPHVLGYFVGAGLLLQARTMVFRRHPLAMGFMVVLCGIGVELVVVFIYAVRSLYDVSEFWALSQLGARIGGLVYSGVIAVLLSFVVVRMLPMFGLSERVEGGGRSRYLVR